LGFFQYYPEMTKAIDSQNTAASQELGEAFGLFMEASKALEAQQAVLQGQIDRLSQELVVANSRLSSLLNSLPSGVILFENHIVIDFNPAALSIVPNLQKDVEWKIPPSWKSLNSVRSGEYLVMVGGQERILQAYEVKSGLRSVLQLQDITSTITSRVEKERSDRLAAMGKMTAGIAHQLRTPLSTALLYASHLSDASLEESQKQLFAERLKTQLMNLEKLAGNMLMFIRQRPHKTSSVQINEILDEACQTVQVLCDERHIQFIHHFDTDGLIVSVEKQSIVAALVAILENALQVTQSGQCIEIHSANQGGRLEITIDDQGPGIAPDMMETLFEPFSTSRITGTGLGLSIARSAIDSHRGEILVSNREGGGARFTILLPCLTEL
jgi:two-component system sensor histidine kinase FlrB